MPQSTDLNNAVSETNHQNDSTTQKLESICSKMQEIIQKVEPLVEHFSNQIRPTEPWRSIAMQTKDLDAAKIDRWNKDIDTLLVYAALFSAVIAAFNIEFYKNLLPEPTTSTNNVTLARLEAQMERTNALLFAMATNTTHELLSMPPIEPKIYVNVATGDGGSSLVLAYNTLWFFSLVLSLISASLATLVKQWIQHYLEQDFDSSSREHLCLRQHRYKGLSNDWITPLIIGSLPMLLRISFFLFLAGLVVELVIISPPPAVLAAFSGGIFLLGYLYTTFAPAVSSDCPYKSPESLLAFNIYVLFWYLVGRPVEGIPDASRAKWRVWRDRELMVTDDRDKITALEMEALITASKDLALSDATLASDIQECARGLHPANCMELVHRIAHWRIKRTTADEGEIKWEELWDYGCQHSIPDREHVYHKITQEGTKALLNIAIDYVLLDSRSVLSDLGPAIACVATLVQHGRFAEPKNFHIRLREVIRRLAGHPQARDKLLFPIFMIAAARCRSTDSDFLAELPKFQPDESDDIAEWVMEEGRNANGLILKQIRTKHFNDGDRDGPGIICYAILKLLSLTGGIAPGPEPEPETEPEAKAMFDARKTSRQSLFEVWRAILQSQKCVDTQWRDRCRSVLMEADKTERKDLIKVVGGEVAT